MMTTTSLTSLNPNEVNLSTNKSQSYPQIVRKNSLKVSDHIKDNHNKSSEEIKTNLIDISKNGIHFEQTIEEEFNEKHEMYDQFVDCLLSPFVFIQEFCKYFCQIPACLCMTGLQCMVCCGALRIRCK